jgi:hypothetical protein
VYTTTRGGDHSVIGEYTRRTMHTLNFLFKRSATEREASIRFNACEFALREWRKHLQHSRKWCGGLEPGTHKALLLY